MSIFPSDWLIKPLEDCLEILIDYRGKTPRKSASGIPLLSAKVIKGGRILDDIFEFLPEEDYDNWMRRGLPRVGDVVMTTEGPLGEIAQLDARKYALGQRIVTLRGKKGLLDNNYLKFIMQSSFIQDQLFARATGTTVLGIKQSELRKISMLLPSLPEQRAIAEMLGSLDDKIEANRRENETLEATARAIFKSWFVDFDPVHTKSRGELPVGMDEETAQLFPDAFVESELGLIPQGWELKRLDEIATYLNGLALQKYPAENDTDFLPIIKIRELRQGITDTSSHRASNAIPSAYIIRDGDVLFSWSGSLLVDLWAGGDGALNQHLFKVNSADYPRWLYYFWTLFYLDEFIQIAEDKATTMGHIKRQHLSEARVVVPNFDVISSLTKFLEPYLEAVVNNRIASRTLAETRDALLPKLMSGEVRA